MQLILNSKNDLPLSLGIAVKEQTPFDKLDFWCVAQISIIYILCRDEKLTIEHFYNNEILTLE